MDEAPAVEPLLIEPIPAEPRDAQLFLSHILSNPVNAEILKRAPQLDIPDWWLTAGALFQTVWNVLDGRDPGTGIRDYDLFYFDPDTSYAAEDSVIRRAQALFADLDVRVEVRNEARVHLWYEKHFGSPADPFTSTADAVDHFAAKTCCFAVTADDDGGLRTYAPFGYSDLFARRVVPNPVLAPHSVYTAKTERWAAEWPSLQIVPWPGAGTDRA